MRAFQINVISIIHRFVLHRSISVWPHMNISFQSDIFFTLKYVLKHVMKPRPYVKCDRLTDKFVFIYTLVSGCICFHKRQAAKARKTIILIERVKRWPSEHCDSFFPVFSIPFDAVSLSSQVLPTEFERFRTHSRYPSMCISVRNAYGSVRVCGLSARCLDSHASNSVVTDWPRTEHQFPSFGFNALDLAANLLKYFQPENMKFY